MVLPDVFAAMEKPSKVEFRNVGQSYFPQTRVECRYSVSSLHKWDNNDWIGLFKVGCSSLKDYYTFAWALVPEGYTEGTDANCCVHFQPFYLPRPGAVAYQFVYVDKKGEVCAVSPQFTFCVPGPLDELVTLEERNGEEEGAGEDLLLVVPKAQILQSHLEECQRELEKLRQKLDAADGEMEREKKKSEKVKEVLKREGDEMKDEITELRESLRCTRKKMENMEGKQKDVQCSQENMSAELSGLWDERVDNQQRIRELEEGITRLKEERRETEVELDRMKERVRKMSTQRRDEEEERKNVQAESEAAQCEVRMLQERLEASERLAEALRRDLSELGDLQGHSHAELHQIRLQAAQSTLQLSQANLALREGQATWAQERDALRQSVESDKERMQKLCREMQRKEEWLQEERAEREKLEWELEKEKDCNRVQLNEARREVQDLKASLRAAQKEREQQQLERQDLLERIHELEHKMEADVDAKWSEVASASTVAHSTCPLSSGESIWSRGNTDSPPSVEEEQETPPPPHPASSLKETPQNKPLILAEPQERPWRVVVINQVSSLKPTQQDNGETQSTEMEGEKMGVKRANKDKLVMAELNDPILCELADCPMW